MFLIISVPRAAPNGHDYSFISIVLECVVGAPGVCPSACEQHSSVIAPVNNIPLLLASGHAALEPAAAVLVQAQPPYSITAAGGSRISRVAAAAAGDAAKAAADAL
jgi:hypothetical protein